MILPAHTKDKRYAILGLGKSGLATAKALLAAGAHVTAWDDGDAARAAAAQNIPLTDLGNTDWHKKTAALVLSPGIPQTHPVAAKAKAAKIPVIGDIDLLFQSQTQARYVGITGTNGKSTTTALIGYILRGAGMRAEVGGNLGTPALSLEPLGAGGIYVLELSSYQLDLMQENPLDVAVMLNLTPDHLERHGGMKAYQAAKTRILRAEGPQTFICGMDDAPSREIAAAAAKKKNIALQGISQAEQKDGTVYVSGKQLIDAIAGKAEPVLDLGALPALPGAHNWQNIAAAYAAASALGLSREAIIAGIKSFPGLEHRQQLVATLGGVKFINDSKATNAEAVAKALACYDPIYLILGGQPKEGGLNGLESFMPRVRHAFLIGQAAQDFARWLDGKAAYTQCGALDAAVKAAAAMAWQDQLPGAVVLLSPACASFDQFKNFEERGAMFADSVRALQTPALGAA